MQISVAEALLKSPLSLHPLFLIEVRLAEQTPMSSMLAVVFT